MALERSLTDHRTLGFWAFHPFGRAVNTLFLYNSYNFLGFDPKIKAPLLLGVLSGAFNIAFRELAERHLNGFDSVEGQALTYLTVAALPWVASFSVMKLLNNLIPRNSSFKINALPAALTGVTIEALGSTNNDYLNRP